MTEVDMLYLCGTCPILPLVILLVIVALLRSSIWLASLALLMAGLPYVLLLCLVASYDTPMDEEVAADQFTGRSALDFYEWIVAAAGSAFLWVGTRRMIRRNPPSGNASTVPTSPR